MLNGSEDVDHYYEKISLKGKIDLELSKKNKISLQK